MILGKLYSWALIAIISIAYGTAAVFGGENLVRPHPLTGVDTVKNWLMPLPKQVSFEGVADFVPEASTLVVGDELSAPEQGAVEELAAHWRNAFGKPLKILRGKDGLKEKASLRIIMGRGDGALVEEAAKAAGIDIGELGKCPNAGQSYMISSIKREGGLDVLLVGGGQAGCYYAALTCRQLLESQAVAAKMPMASVVDWPDLVSRGIWGCSSASAQGIETLSRVKLNLIHVQFVTLAISESKQITVNLKGLSEIMRVCGRGAIDVYPILLHSDQLKSSTPLATFFPEIFAVGDKSKFGSVCPLCFSKPETQKVMNDILVGMAKIATTGIAVWLGEDAGKACQCPNCGGNEETQFIKEVDCVATAFAAARKIKPALKLFVCLTQGTYKHNTEIVRHLPKDVEIGFYSSPLTYSTERAPMIPPAISAMAAEGRPVLGLPLLGGTWSDGEPLYPCSMAGFVRERMAEMKEKKLEGFISWLPPNIFVHEFETDAMAEYAWNVSGRSPYEFALAWSTRKGYAPDDAERIATLYTMLEAPERDFYTTTFNWNAGYMLSNIMDALEGKISMGFGPGTALKGFADEATFKIYDDSLAKAEGIAGELRDPRFLFEPKIMRRWLSLLYHCHCLKAEARKPAPDKDRVAAEFAAIDDDLRMIPIVWEQWIKVVTGDPKSNAWSQGYAGAPFWFKEYAGDDAPIWRKSLESCLAVFKKRLDAFKAKFR